MKVSVTGIGPCGWLTEVMVQLAVPVASVTPEHVWAEPLEPSWKATVRPAMGAPRPESPSVSGAVLSLLRTPESVSGWPFCATVGPV